MQQESVFVCRNCQKEVPEANRIAHEGYCQRNNWRCPECGEVVRFAEREGHSRAHEPVRCGNQGCGALVKPELLQGHLERECPRRQVICQFCSLPHAAADLPRHAEACGSRTSPCEVCGARVRLSDMDEHLVSKCSYPPQQQQEEEELEALRRRVLEGELEPRRGEGAVLVDPRSSRCPWCGVGLGDFEELQIHMLTECSEREGRLRDVEPASRTVVPTNVSSVPSGPRHTLHRAPPSPAAASAAFAPTSARRTSPPVVSATPSSFRGRLPPAVAAASTTNTKRTYPTSSSAVRSSAAMTTTVSTSASEARKPAVPSLRSPVKTARPVAAVPAGSSHRPLAGTTQLSVAASSLHALPTNARRVSQKPPASPTTFTTTTTTTSASSHRVLKAAPSSTYVSASARAEEASRETEQVLADIRRRLRELRTDGSTSFPVGSALLPPGRTGRAAPSRR